MARAVQKTHLSDGGFAVAKQGVVGVDADDMAYARNPDALKAGGKVSYTLVFRVFSVVRNVYNY